MSGFRKYMHIEKFGNEAVQNIELGEVYVFPKLDGTNTSVWNMNQERGYPSSEGEPYICAGSRERELSLEKDNAGFLRHMVNEGDRHRNFLLAYPNYRLYGEWLVPHSFKGYREGAWRQFYVFDVYDDKAEEYLSYSRYQGLLEDHGINYIPPLAIIKNGTYENFLKYMNDNLYLCPDGGEPGEGIVIKNYDFYNRFGDQVWAKMVRQVFKELHHKAMGPPEINGGLMNEELIVNKVLTSALIDKTMAKIKLAESAKALKMLPVGWSSKMIPELFGRLFYDIITEELFDAWKECDYGSINGKTLKAMMIRRVKELKPEMF